MSNKGDRGMRGMIASCPACGSSSKNITWDPKTDTCTCACGWTNNSINEKQIEEMAKVIERMPWKIVQEGFGCRIYNNRELAEYFYTEGYCKQSKGEWKHPPYAPFGGSYTMKQCSICEYKPDFDNDHPYTKFCPNCGAKMKGGAGSE